MKIGIIGAHGQLGSDLTRVLRAEHTVVALTHAEVEVSDPASLEAMFNQHAPDLVMSMAAFHKVDLCEEQVEQTFAVNAFGARNVAMTCRAHGAAMLYVSSDYVFGGERMRRSPYAETDAPAPINVYGISKLAGE
ncbi:MAG: sugar nucleotide-binding protein, partial [Chloroflexi bacterium]|nr:sugar nucleotide-binding protein [Chloroflexota bacterium]